MAEIKSLGEVMEFDDWAEAVVQVVETDRDDSRTYNLVTHPVSRVVWTRDETTDVITITLYPLVPSS